MTNRTRTWLAMSALPRGNTCGDCRVASRVNSEAPNTMVITPISAVPRIRRLLNLRAEINRPPPSALSQLFVLLVSHLNVAIVCVKLEESVKFQRVRRKAGRKRSVSRLWPKCPNLAFRPESAYMQLSAFRSTFRLCKRERRRDGMREVQL